MQNIENQAITPDRMAHLLQKLEDIPCPYWIRAKILARKPSKIEISRRGFWAMQTPPLNPRLAHKAMDGGGMVDEVEK